MKVRLLEIDLDKKGYYRNKVITIIDGYNVPPFKYDVREPTPLH